MSKPKYQPGDRVVYTRYGGGAGAIVKASKVTALWLRDGDQKESRDGLNALRPETAEDVAKRSAVEMEKEWLVRVPVTAIARTTSPPYYGSVPTGVEMLRVTTPEAMRRAADELRLLADWFESRPIEGKKPSHG